MERSQRKFRTILSRRTLLSEGFNDARDQRRYIFASGLPFVSLPPGSVHSLAYL